MGDKMSQGSDVNADRARAEFLLQEVGKNAQRAADDLATCRVQYLMMVQERDNRIDALEEEVRYLQDKLVVLQSAAEKEVNPPS